MAFLETANGKPNCKQQTAAASIFTHVFGRSSDPKNLVVDIMASKLGPNLQIHRCKPEKGYENKYFLTQHSIFTNYNHAARETAPFVRIVCKISLSFRLSFSLSDMTNYESADF